MARPACFALFCCVFSLCWGFGSPRPRGVGHLPARVTPASACWHRRGGCFAWGFSWSWISCLVWMGPTLSRRRTRLLGIFLLFAFSSCSGATSVDPFFFWWVCGVTVSWKGSQVTRGAAVLCGGVGRDRYLWGRWLGTTLSSLGAGIANLSVTGIRGDDNHVQYAASGTGFSAVSHGAQYVAGPGPICRP